MFELTKFPSTKLLPRLFEDKHPIIAATIQSMFYINILY